MTIAVEYWSIPLEDISRADQLLALLSRDEQGRSQQFKREELRGRFILARASLRQILGFYLQQDPATIVFHYGQFGKPTVDGIAFNLSHTKKLALCAVIPEQILINVGIDLEMKDRIIDVMGLARRFFNPTEIKFLETLSTAQQQDYFLQFWTAKEAYLKALGTGIQGGLEQAIIQLQPTLKLQIPDSNQWSLTLLQPDPHHWGAIAVENSSAQFINRGEWMI